jgi:hypothetical protein
MDTPMKWNYRIVLMQQHGETWYEIREVFYEDDGTPAGHCDAIPAGDDKEELERLVERFEDAFRQPILKFNEC